MGLFETEAKVPQTWEMERTDEERFFLRSLVDPGTMHLSCFDLLPGMVLMDIDLSATTLPAFNSMDASFYTVNWCEQGRCETSLDEEGTVVVGERTLCLSSSSAMEHSYPTGRYRGFECVICPDMVDESGWAVLGSLGLGPDSLCPVPNRQTVTVKPTGELLDAVEGIVRELGRQSPRRTHLLLDACRLLLIIAEADLEALRLSGAYLQRSQRDMAQAIYEQIVGVTSPVVDLRPLAAKFGVSEASLRTYFSKVYGSTPAAFARAHALRTAAEMLAQGDASVSEVALACGYSNPSKFAAAFRRLMGTTPLEYRRRCRMGT